MRARTAAPLTRLILACVVLMATVIPRQTQIHSIAGFGPNHALSLSDFPLHTSVRDNNNIVGSQGVFRNNFNDVMLGQAAENETSIADPVWSIADGNGGMVNVRRSTPRNAPPVINAVFNYRNFWDGRAQRTFNGVNPFGAGDPNAQPSPDRSQQSRRDHRSHASSV